MNFLFGFRSLGAQGNCYYVAKELPRRFCIRRSFQKAFDLPVLCALRPCMLGSHPLEEMLWRLSVNLYVREGIGKGMLNPSLVFQIIGRSEDRKETLSANKAHRN